MTESWSDAVAGGLGVEPVDEFGTLRADVAPDRWQTAVRAARDWLGCTFFDWLTAVDEPPDTLRLVCHLARPPRDGAPMRRLLLRTTVARTEPVLASVSDVFAGADWHEREVREMFGVEFTGAASDTALRQLLLPAGFEGHPLRKDFVLASRVAAPWPGAKEPGESDALLASRLASGRAPRRRVRPPGVPAPEDWGPSDEPR